MRPEGFKDSDIGPIPQDWEVRALGDVCSMQSGQTITAKNIGHTGSYPCYGGNGVRGYTQTYTHDGVFPLIGRQGALCGNTKLATGKFYASEHAVVVTCNQKTRPIWLYYMLGSMNLGQYAEASAQPGLAVSKILRQYIPYTSLPEQQAIADALSDIDALISAQEELLAKKRAIKQGAMQELLTGRRRLPGFPVRPMKQTDIGPIPEDWEVKQLGKLTSISAGGTPSTNYPEYWNGSIPWMSSGELHAKYISEVKGRITQCGLDNSAAQMLPCGCVLIGLAGQGKTRGTVAYNEIPLCTNQSIAAIFPDSHFISLFVYHYLDNQYYELRALSSGDGGRGGLNIKILGTVSVPFPSLAEQESIAMILSNMDAEITAVEEELAKQRALKRGMMQELLCGRIRLPYNKPTHRKQHA